MALNDEQIEKLKRTVSTEGWNEIILPSIASWGKEAIRNLLLEPSERAGEYKGMDDGAIRQRARAIEWFLSTIRNELAVADHNRRLDELDRQEQETPAANPQS